MIFSHIPAHRDISRFSEYFDNTMYCRWWNIQVKAIIHWGMLFWKNSIYCFFCRLLLLRDSASLRYSFYTQLRCWPLSCSMFLQLFIFTTFLSLLLPPSQLFWDVLHQRLIIRGCTLLTHPQLNDSFCLSYHSIPLYSMKSSQSLFHFFIKTVIYLSASRCSITIYFL